MKCPKCDFEQADSLPECQQCGVIFAKLFKKSSQTVPRRQEGAKSTKSNFDPDIDATPLQRLLLPQCPQSMLALLGRSLLLLFLLFLTVKFSFSAIKDGVAGNSFLHLVNLPFHEAGHIFFRPLGRIMTSLGGTLAQILMPLVCLVALLFQTRDPFGGAVCLWWFGENFQDIAPYIDDARSLSLPLLGGNFGYSSPYGFHDWQFILTELGLLRFDHILARMAHLFGMVMMCFALGWGVLVVLKGLSLSGS